MMVGPSDVVAAAISDQRGAAGWSWAHLIHQPSLPLGARYLRHLHFLIKLLLVFHAFLVEG